ncbi:MAG: phosphatidate cytidylyltransferase [Alphaproteobacteria bacterium]|jgi:phosphatidate cytidylyltransferase|nr:phosphatidate cytidylyltransferase [Alphaproteobacteria bacterium]
MTPTAQLLMLFAGLTGVLTLASATGQVLAGGRLVRLPRPLLANLTRRINAWWLMVALVGLAFVLGQVGIIVLAALVSFAAMREWLSSAPLVRGDHGALVVSFYVVLPAQYLLLAFGTPALFSLFIPIAALVALPVTVAFGDDVQRFAGRVGTMQWGLMLAVWGLSHLAALAMLDIPGHEGGGLLLVAFLVLVAQASDVLQYVFGMLFGRRPIAPRLSPAKTVEGFVGGATSATLLGAGLWWLTPFHPLAAAALACLVVVLGFLGGLVLSAVKRERGLEDWGTAIAGHGGVLDRVDSLILSAPVFFYLVRYFWPA